MIYQQYQTKYVIVNENLLCDHSDTVRSPILRFVLYITLSSNVSTKMVKRRKNNDTHSCRKYSVCVGIWHCFYNIKHERLKILSVAKDALPLVLTLNRFTSLVLAMFSWSLFGVMPFANFCQEIKSKNTKLALDRNPQGHPKMGGQKYMGKRNCHRNQGRLSRPGIFFSQNFKLE